MNSVIRLNDYEVSIRESDGYMDVTEICRVGGKRFPDWYRLKGSKQLIDDFRSFLTSEEVHKVDIIQIGSVDNSHTYAHPYLAIQIAQWVSNRFAFEVSHYYYRYKSGDLTLVPDIIANNDKLNDTETKLIATSKQLEALTIDNKLKHEEIQKLQERDKVVTEISNSITSNPLVRVDAITENDRMIMQHNTNRLLMRQTILKPIVEIATEMGYRINRNNQIGLGSFVSSWYVRTKQTGREKRIGGAINMSVPVWWYIDNEELRETIEEFFAR